MQLYVDPYLALLLGLLLYLELVSDALLLSPLTLKLSLPCVRGGGNGAVLRCARCAAPWLVACVNK